MCPCPFLLSVTPGTYVAQPKQGTSKRGGPNGSLAASCLTNTCGLAIATAAAPTDTCPDGYPSRSGFSDGGHFCCPAGFCVAHGQTTNGTPQQGKVIPMCLAGDQATNELCRQENDSLMPTMQFYRNRQNNPNFKLPSGEKLSIADIIVLGAAAAVSSCSGGAVDISVAVGRVDYLAADDMPLPSPDGVINDRHNSIFQTMGLNKVSPCNR